jgi:NADH dehydrogenase
MKKIAVIGDGFAALNLVRHLAADGSFYIPRAGMDNVHLFPPLLFQQKSMQARK